MVVVKILICLKMLIVYQIKKAMRNTQSQSFYQERSDTNINEFSLILFSTVRIPGVAYMEQSH